MVFAAAHDAMPCPTSNRTLAGRSVGGANNRGVAFPAAPGPGKGPGNSGHPDHDRERHAGISPSERLRACFGAGSHGRHYQPDSTILLHGEPARTAYLVQSGTVRCCRIDAEGHRQIFDFVTKGFFLGLEDVGVWHFTAEAVDHVILRATPQQRIVDACCRDGALRDAFRSHACHLLERRERQLISLVHLNAQQRLLQFLRDFAQRRRSDGFVALPMQRRDIADHLGLSVETVSRAFSDLKRKSLIDMASPEKFRLLPVAGRPSRGQRML